MNENAAIAICVVALCAMVSMCMITDKSRMPQDALSRCLDKCRAESCMKLCGEIIAQAKGATP